MLRVTVRDREGLVLSQTVKPCNGRAQKAIRAAHTRYTNLAMKEFYGVWHTISVVKV